MRPWLEDGIECARVRVYSIAAENVFSRFYIIYAGTGFRNCIYGIVQKERARNGIGERECIVYIWLIGASDGISRGNRTVIRRPLPVCPLTSSLFAQKQWKRGDKRSPSLCNEIAQTCRWTAVQTVTSHARIRFTNWFILSGGFVRLNY